MVFAPIAADSLGPRIFIVRWRGGPRRQGQTDREKLRQFSSPGQTQALWPSAESESQSRQGFEHGANRRGRRGAGFNRRHVVIKNNYWGVTGAVSRG